MKPPRPQLAISTGAGIALLALTTWAGAGELATRVSNHRDACADMTVRLAKDLRLAMKVEEGESVFLQYVRFRRPYEQWTTAEAIERARAAAVTPCGVAIGLRTIDERSFPKLLIRDGANDSLGASLRGY